MNVPVSGPALAADWSEADLAAMRRAIDLAWGGAGRVGTNPLVGAVVVAGGEVVGTGFHRQAGVAHAETVALDTAGARACGATLHASLEPCAHHGRTPPCVDRIVRAGVARVVVAAMDPDPRVRGRGVRELRERGVRVDVGCLAATAILDNLGYHRDRLGLATTVTLKVAVSADGMVARAPGRRDDVTGLHARREVHALRASHDAVIVGVGTAVVDNPRLDCRWVDGPVDREPVPVVLDSRLRIPPDNAWAQAGRAYVVVASPDADAGRAAAIERRGGRVLRCPAGPSGIDVPRALDALADVGLARVLVEGGPRVLRSFVASGLWDALWLYRSPVVFGHPGVPLGISSGAVPGRRIDESRAGDDMRVRLVNGTRFDDMLGRLHALAGE